MDEAGEARDVPRPASTGPELVLIPEQFAIRIGSDQVRMTPTQFRILEVLAAEPEQVFTREALIGRIIGRRVTLRTIDVHVKELRRKLGIHGKWVQTVRGAGYVLRHPTDTDGVSSHGPA